MTVAEFFSALPVVECPECRMVAGMPCDPLRTYTETYIHPAAECVYPPCELWRAERFVGAFVNVGRACSSCGHTWDETMNASSVGGG